MSDTLCIFVNCSQEQTRHETSCEAVRSFLEEDRNKSLGLLPHTVVFDNGSTWLSAHEMLVRSFDCPVYHSTTNKGYWSALSWLFDNVVKDDHKYVYIIESDHTHYALEKIRTCASFLDTYPQVGSVRAQEYSITDRHLYDKTHPHPQSRHYAWVSHVNAVTREPVTLVQSDMKDVWLSNFLTCLHSVNRTDVMKRVFNALKQRESFSEHTFQKLYHNEFSVTGVLDGGMFHAKLGFGFYDKSKVSGSWCNVEKLEEVGYLPTRNDAIREYSDNEIVRLK